MTICEPPEAAPVEIFGRDRKHPNLTPLTSEELIAQFSGSMSSEEVDRLETAIEEMCEKVDEAPSAP